MIKAFSSSKSVRHIGFTWALSLPICFILGWIAGYFLTPIRAEAFIGSNIGSLIGLTLGGTIGGLGTALELRAKYPTLKAVYIIMMCFGWTLAFFIVGFIRYTMALDD